MTMYLDDADRLKLFPVFDDSLYARVGSDGLRARMVADTVAWAVSRGVPLHEALSKMPFSRKIGAIAPRWRFGMGLIRDFFLPLHPLTWFPNTRWSWMLGLVIRDLEKGEPLSVALEKNAGRYLPGFYLMGVAQAESTGSLETALPLLARQLEYPVAVSGRRRAAYFLLTWRLAILIPLFIGFMIFIMPVFKEMFLEMGGRLPVPSLVVNSSARNVAGLLLAVILPLLILAKTEGIGEYVVLRIPVVGRDYRQLIRSDLARSMAAFIRQGSDVTTAAEYSLRSTRSQWMRGEIQRFIDALGKGVHWAEAWGKFAAVPPLERWLMKNAAAREDPAQGFELVADWLCQEIESTTQWIEQWADPLATIVLGIAVGFLAFAGFLPIFYMHQLVIH